MAKFQKSFYLVLIVLIYTVETGLRPVSTQTTTDTNPSKNTNTPIDTTKSRIAFLVGINSYKATTSLKYAVGDSEAIEDLLLRTGKYDKLIKLNDYGKIITTLNPETQIYSSQRIKMAPTKANIEATYKEVLAENPDTLLFYYSGHGFIEGEGGENFIAPKDVDVKFEKRKVGKEEKHVPVPLNGISLKTMGIQAAKVKRVVFLIDACRSPLPEAEGEEIQIADAGKKELTAKSAKEDKSKDGDVTFKEIQLRQNLLSTKTDKLPKRVLEAEGITMLIGAAPEVSSLEDEDFKSGIFTHFLKKAFNGGVQEENQEEYITEENLSRFIEDRFKHYYELRKKESETAAEPKLYNLTFDRGKKGELLLTYHRPIEGKERIDKPIYFDTTRDREVNGKLVYNEKGEREDLRFFVHDEKRDVYYPDSLEGVYKMEYSFKKDKAGELENFTATEFNLKNDKVFEYGTKLIPDVGWEYRGLYAQIDGSTHSTSSGESSSPTRSQIKFERKVYDFNGNNISEEYFDKKGQLIEINGVAKIVRAYDKDGQKILEEFYGKDTLDEYGDIAENGELVAKDGFARYKAKYKSRGNLLLETWEDLEGKIADNQFGYSKTKYIYDKNDKLIRKKFYDKENKPANDKWGIASYSYSYNSDCIRFYESKISSIKNEFKQKALLEWKLEKYKLCLSVEVQTDKEDKPVGNEKKVYKKIKTFNKKGYLVSEESFRADKRRHVENGVAKTEYLHDKDGNIISRKNFGEFEVNKKPVPVSDGNGVHEYRYTYQEYFIYDGKPILNECIYYRKEKGILLEPYSCALKIKHFGIDGKPIEDKQGISHTKIYYKDGYQEEVYNLYFTKNDIIIHSKEKKKIITNPFGNIILELDFDDDSCLIQENVYNENNKLQVIENRAYFNGMQTLSVRGEEKYDKYNNKILEVTFVHNLLFLKADKNKDPIIWRKEEWTYDQENKLVQYNRMDVDENRDEKQVYKYDENGKIRLQMTFDLKDGKKILIEKEEWKYDKRKNVIFNADYQVKNRKLYLVRKGEYSFDEKNNKTLMVSYKEKEGKEVIADKSEYKYDEKNNLVLNARYVTDGVKLSFYEKDEYTYDDKNNKTQELKYKPKQGMEFLILRKEYKYDQKNNKLLEQVYEILEGKEISNSKTEYKYDERNNLILQTWYNKDIFSGKAEQKYDEKNNKIFEAHYRVDDGKLYLDRKSIYKYDERNNKILDVFYRTEEEKEVLQWKYEYKYDEKKNKNLDSKYVTKEGLEVLESKSNFEFRSDLYSRVLNQYAPQIESLEKHIDRIKDSKEEKDILENKSLIQKLEDLKKEFEAKKKKYTLTEEKFGPNEKLEFASYKLLFFNPQGPAYKRLMRVDLDLFYRPVKVGFEEE